MCFLPILINISYSAVKNYETVINALYHLSTFFESIEQVIGISNIPFSLILLTSCC